VAGFALACMAGPGVLGAALSVGQLAVPGLPLAGVVIVALGIAAYFAPLWDHLSTCLGAGEAADLPEGDAAKTENEAPP
jgi:hypothetical protein